MQMRAGLLFVLSAYISACTASTDPLTGAIHGLGGAIVKQPKPIIGVLTQPFHSPGSAFGLQGASLSYFPASYAKYVEMAGSRTVPVLCDSTTEELDALYDSINGLIVPGGAQDLRPGNCYYDAMARVMDRAMQDFDESEEIFPIHFTCLGWEAVSVKVTNNPWILSNFTGAEGISDVLNWTPEAQTAESLQLVPRAVLYDAATSGLAYEAHMFGIWLPDFEGTELSDFFTLLSTTTDMLGKVYVSTAQAKRYPFIGVQWHPEKSSFEFSATGVNHGVEAVLLAQGVANQFVQWARQSSHRFASDDDMEEHLLLNYQPVHVPAGYFEAVYIFPMRTKSGGDRMPNPFFRTYEVALAQFRSDLNITSQQVSGSMAVAQGCLSFLVTIMVALLFLLCEFMLFV